MPCCNKLECLKCQTLPPQLGQGWEPTTRFCSVRGSTLVNSFLACKYQTKSEVTDSGKHSSLLRYGKNYTRKMFYSTGYWGQCYKSFLSELSIFLTNLECLLYQAVKVCQEQTLQLNTKINKLHTKKLFIIGSRRGPLVYLLSYLLVFKA